MTKKKTPAPITPVTPEDIQKDIETRRTITTGPAEGGVELYGGAEGKILAVDDAAAADQPIITDQTGTILDSQLKADARADGFPLNTGIETEPKNPGELSFADPQSVLTPVAGTPIEVQAVKHWIVDFDDFSNANSEIDLINALLRIPGYKITLFTVPGLSTREWLTTVAKNPQLELALHGQNHTHLECRDWSTQKTIDVLRHYEAWGIFQKIFKAPYWEITDDVYRGIIACGWALAEHEKNRKRVPKEIPCYFLMPEHSVHGHIGDVCGNGIREKFDYYASLRGEFHFVSEYIADVRDAMGQR